MHSPSPNFTGSFAHTTCTNVHFYFSVSFASPSYQLKGAMTCCEHQRDHLNQNQNLPLVVFLFGGMGCGRGWGHWGWGNAAMMLAEVGY